MSGQFDGILDYLKKEWGSRINQDNEHLLIKHISLRLEQLRCSTLSGYWDFIKNNPAEMHALIELITVNVTTFFRNPLVFEYMAERLIPVLLLQKAREKNLSVRIWSAGCATGEEAYSLAILFLEELENQQKEADISILATDIDKQVLEEGVLTRYYPDNLKNVKKGLLDKYFALKDDVYTLSPLVKQMVRFSVYDLLDTKTFCPPESIFGSFDLIMCRNVLIYYDNRYQLLIFKKLLQSLNEGKYLILGDSESPPAEFGQKLEPVENYCKIYRKKQVD